MVILISSRLTSGINRKWNVILDISISWSLILRKSFIIFYFTQDSIVTDLYPIAFHWLTKWFLSREGQLSTIFLFLVGSLSEKLFGKLENQFRWRLIRLAFLFVSLLPNLLSIYFYRFRNSYYKVSGIFEALLDGILFLEVLNKWFLLSLGTSSYWISFVVKLLEHTFLRN